MSLLFPGEPEPDSDHQERLASNAFPPFFSTTTKPLPQLSHETHKHDDEDDAEEFPTRRRRTSSLNSSSVLDRGRPTSRPSSFFGATDLDSLSGGNDFTGMNSSEGSRELLSGDWDRDSQYRSATTGVVGDRERTSSFFGMPVSSSAASPVPLFESSSSSSHAMPVTHSSDHNRSSFYGLETQGVPTRSYLASGGESGSESHSSHDLTGPPRPSYHQAPYAASRAASVYGPSTLDESAPSAPLFDHSHLQPGALASLLSHEKTLELYRANAKKTNDPDVQFEFCTFVMEVVGEMQQNNAATGVEGEAKLKQQALVGESIALLGKLANRGHVKSQYFLADCYTQGIGTPKGKRDYDKAYPLFVLAGKHGHADACFRAAQCCEHGWGCSKASAKAVSLLRRAAVLSHPGAMHRLGLAEINGELGLTKRPREGIKWLKRAAELADSVDPPQPQSLHELALLSEKGIDNVIFKDEEYAAELLARASELHYAPSAYKLGECYEYGKMGCPQDSALSIHYYNIAAQQNHREACFALTAWYLVGSPGVLPQSDTEAYLWARKAANMSLAKAEYAVGYFTEVGIGTHKDPREAFEWFTKAALQGDKRAKDRLRLASGAARSPSSDRVPPTSVDSNALPSSTLTDVRPASKIFKPPITSVLLQKKKRDTSTPPPRPHSVDRSRIPTPTQGRDGQPPEMPSIRRQRSASQPNGGGESANFTPIPYAPQRDGADPYAEFTVQDHYSEQYPSSPDYGTKFKPLRSGEARMPTRQQSSPSPVPGAASEATRDKVLQRRKQGDDKDCVVS